MSEQQKTFPEFYVTAPQPCPYLPDRVERKLFTHLTREKSSDLVDSLLKGGFRRSQNIAYMPYCVGCQSCISIRVVVDEFKPRRSMRRIITQNSGLEAERAEAIPTSEQYGLFRNYIDARHGDGGMADMSLLDYAMMVRESVIDSFITQYRPRPDDGLTANAPRGPLLAAALCDRLSDGISMVYSFFDTAAATRSLGSYMILEHIEYARQLGLPYLYLGYWIKGSDKMAYKARFGPQEHLTDDGWQRV